MTIKILDYSFDNLSDIAEYTKKIALENGASSAEVDINVSSGKSVSVRLQKLETIEQQNDKSLSVTVFIGFNKGMASTSDFNPSAIRDCVLAACQIAKYTAADNAFGLADKELYAQENRELELYHSWTKDESEIINEALACEASAMDFNTLINNSEGAQLSAAENIFIYANTNGFLNGFPSSRYYLSCSVLGGKDSSMQRDSAYSSARSYKDLKSPKEIGCEAASRTLKRLNPKKISTGVYPVIFEAPIATSIISSLVSAISGGNLYRENSFLMNSINTKIASNVLTIEEDPYLLRGNASKLFDDEGVQVKKRTVIKDGVLNDYFLSSYSARRLGMKTTGNAGGSHNLLIQNSSISFDELVTQMDKGLIVTELLGHGLNMITGDYSRGAAGLWVEGGIVQFAVEEITIASNIKDMLNNIEAIGSDKYTNGGKYTGSILIKEMTIGSNN
jgi:PmbA protein